MIVTTRRQEPIPAPQPYTRCALSYRVPGALQELVFYVEMAANGMFGNTTDGILPPNEDRYFTLKAVRGGCEWEGGCWEWAAGSGRLGVGRRLLGVGCWEWAAGSAKEATGSGRLGVGRRRLGAVGGPGRRERCAE